MSDTIRLIGLEHFLITIFVTLTDYFPQADLESYRVQHNNGLAEEAISSALNFSLQMANIFLEMHQLGYTFTDAKNSNWLIDENHQLKIADTKSFIALTPDTNMVDFNYEPNKWLRKDLKASYHLFPKEFFASANNPFLADKMASYMLGKNLYHYLTGCSISFLCDTHPDPTIRIKPKSSFNDADFHHSVFQGLVGQELKLLIQKLVKPEAKNRLSLSEATAILASITKLQHNLNHPEGITREKMQTVMQNPHLNVITKLNYLQTIDDKGLLKPLIRLMWKENRAQNISSSIFCHVSDAESVYRAIQNIYAQKQEGQNRVLSLLTLIQKYALTSKENKQPFYIALTEAFNLEVINQVQQEPVNSSNREPFVQ